MLIFNYLIIGGGMTADSAVKGIRKIDPDGTIAIIASENETPYDRPPLSKKLWKGKPLDEIWRKTDAMGVRIFKGHTAIKIDTEEMQVEDDKGNSYVYDKLLLATGGRPRRLPFGGDDIIYFRTVEDYRRLRKLADDRSSFAVIGGGFIGSEIAAALAMNGKDVTMIFPETGIGARVFPKELSDFLNGYYQSRGVQILAGESVAGVSRKDGQLVLASSGGKEIAVDGIVAGLGVEPEVGLARQAGLTIRNGIVVDKLLRTTRMEIFAAGDVAEFYNPSLDMSVRVEHEDNANMMGIVAGGNMAGRQEHYNHLPYFYSDLFDLGYEAVGILDSRLETHVEWEEPNLKGKIYYLEGQRLRGMLMWNVWDKVEEARRMISLVRFSSGKGEGA